MATFQNRAGRFLLTMFLVAVILATATCTTAKPPEETGTSAISGIDTTDNFASETYARAIMLSEHKARNGGCNDG